jgi:hypothetical protein
MAWSSGPKLGLFWPWGLGFRIRNLFPGSGFFSSPDRLRHLFGIIARVVSELSGIVSLNFGKRTFLGLWRKSNMPKYEIWFDNGEQKSRQDLEAPDLFITAHDLSDAASKASSQHPYPDTHYNSTIVMIIKKDQTWYHVQTEKGWSVIKPAEVLTFDEVCQHFETDL